MSKIFIEVIIKMSYVLLKKVHRSNLRFVGAVRDFGIYVKAEQI